MRFDVVVANPPYHEVMEGIVSGKNKSAFKPIYHLFIDRCRRITPGVMVFIVPARWFSAGRHLDEWRPTMINDTRIKALIDYTDSASVFGEQVSIAGGVCIFSWYGDKTEEEVFVMPEGEKKDATHRPLNTYDVIVRDNNALSIIEAVLEKETRFLSDWGQSTNYFNIKTNLSNIPLGHNASISEVEDRGWIPLYTIKGVICVNPDAIPYSDSTHEEEGEAMINAWKVVFTRGVDFGSRENKQVISRCDIIPPPSAVTGSFVIIGHFDNKDEALNMQAYLKTKFARFMLSLRANTQQIAVSRLRWIPNLDYTKTWTDKELYKRYGLNTQQQAHIEKTISNWQEKPWRDTYAL